MRRFLQIMQIVCISGVLLGIVVPILLTWTTDLLSLEAVSKWLHSELKFLADMNPADDNFQFLSLLIVGLPTSIILLLVGALCHLGQKTYDNPAVTVKKLGDQLERFLLVYDSDFNFTGRLRKLIDAYDENRFQDLRRLVYKAVYQYCGALEEGKETFLLIPSDTSMLSVVNEEVCEAVLENLINVKVCRSALTVPATQFVLNAARHRGLIMTPKQWILPDCRSILVCPVYIGGTPTGLIGVYHSKANAFSTDVDQVFLELMASILSLAYTIRAKEVAK